MASLKQGMPLLWSLARAGVDVVFPPRCASCRGEVAADGNFCAACFEKLKLIAAPMCRCCGIPFEIPLGEDAQCPECLATPPNFSIARAAMVYDAVSAPLVSALKFSDQWTGLSRHAGMMAGAGSSVLAGADMLVPVPLHWRRLLRRKYNQSALLGFAIAARSGVPCHPELLRRVVHTKPQMRLDRKTRLQNVKRAFAVPVDKIPALHDKVIVLVDDVITTGATMDACAKVLRKAGAKEVRALALARTVKE